jgi:hypothetical protein
MESYKVSAIIPLSVEKYWNIFNQNNFDVFVNTQFNNKFTELLKEETIIQDKTNQNINHTVILRNAEVRPTLQFPLPDVLKKYIPMDFYYIEKQKRFMDLYMMSFDSTLSSFPNKELFINGTIQIEPVGSFSCKQTITVMIHNKLPISTQIIKQFMMNEMTTIYQQLPSIVTKYSKLKN